ncbi:MAG: hypothetical protein ACRYGI_04540 [Janthinobacterium lividum]
MRDPTKPSSIPSLLPFLVMAVLLVVIFLGFALFPMFKTMITQQDCVASGRTDCSTPP